MENQILDRLRQSINSNDRPQSLLEVAKDIEWLKENYGNTTKIGKALGISSGMVNTFLSALKVSPAVQQFVADRKIDSVFGVHALKSFEEQDQMLVAKALVDGDFSSQHARALVPLYSSP